MIPSNKSSIIVSHNSESSSSSEKQGSPNPSTTSQNLSDPFFSPTSEPYFERNAHSKKPSHFSDIHRNSEPIINLHFNKLDILKGDDAEHIAIELPPISSQSRTNENLITDEIPHKDQNEQKEDGNNSRKMKRGLSIKPQQHYFVSENSFENEQANFGEIIQNDLNFNYKVFFQFFFMHLLFYVFLGPFSSFLIAIIWGWNLAKNQFFWGFNGECILQTVEFLIIFSVFFPYYFYSFPNIYMIEIYMIMAAVLLRISIISIKYATMNEDKIKLIKTQEVPHEELKNEFTLNNFKEIDDIELEKELQITIIRKDIDVALLLFRFLSNVNQDVHNQIQSDYNPFQIENEKKTFISSKKDSLQSLTSPTNIYNSPSSNSSKKISMINPALSAFLNTSKVGKRINLYNTFIAEDDMKSDVYSGYLLSKLILKKGYKNSIKPRWFIIVGVTISLIHALIPSCYRIYDKGFFFGESLTETLLIVGTFVVNVYLFFLNLMFLMFGIYEFERQVRTLNQLSNLMSSKKLSTFNDEKFTPTIDFFCKLSLKSWGSLHQIIRGFGAKYKLRIECYLTLFSLFYLIVTILVISAIFGNLQSLYNFSTLIVLTFEVLLMSICMIMLISIGVTINKQYQVHKALIKTNKDVISDLLRLYIVYFEKREYKPENEVYKKGVEKVMQNVNYYLMNNIEVCNPRKWEHEEFKKKVTKRILKDLINICDEIMEELSFENMYEPFRINGIAATPKVLHSIFAIFGSLLFAVGQKYINNLMN